MLNIFILGLTSLFTDISTEMVYPLIPLYLSTQLGVSPSIIGLIEGIAESIASLLRVFSGYISDLTKKRKSIAIMGYSLSLFGKIFLYISRVWGDVLTSRVVDRFGKGVRTAPRDALIADSISKEKRGRGYGFHRALDTLGATIGVLLAYYFFTSFRGDFKRVFLYSLIPAFIGVILLFFAKEKKIVQKKEEKPSLRFRGLSGRLKIFLLIVLLFALGNSSNQFLLLRARSIGVGLSTILLFYLAYNIVYAGFSYPLGRLSDRVGRKRILVMGYLVYGLVYLGFGMAKTQLHLWLLFGLYGLYSGFTEGVEKAFIVDLAPTHLRSTVLGLHSTLVGIGLFPASFIAGILWNIGGPSLPFFFGGGLGIIAALALSLLI